MEVSEGVEATKSMVCLILQSLYGLKQSAFLWNRKIQRFAKKIGFLPITTDASVFINSQEVIITLYIDDILIFIKDQKDINCIKKDLKKFHLMKDLDPVNKILSVKIKHNSGSIQLSQDQYIQYILEEFRIENSKPAEVLISSSLPLEDTDSKSLSPSDYQTY
jgi:hypothetical protein